MGAGTVLKIWFTYWVLTSTNICAMNEALDDTMKIFLIQCDYIAGASGRRMSLQVRVNKIKMKSV